DGDRHRRTVRPALRRSGEATHARAEGGAGRSRSAHARRAGESAGDELTRTNLGVRAAMLPPFGNVNESETGIQGCGVRRFTLLRRSAWLRALRGRCADETAASPVSKPCGAPCSWLSPSSR